MLLVLMVMYLQAQEIIYVANDATGANNGTSWADAYTSLHDALAAAIPGTETTAGSQIWIKKGRYTPSDTDRFQSFAVNSSISIYGSFEGTETQIDQRPIVANDPNTITTRIDGNIGDPDIETDNSNRLFAFLNPTAFNILNGLHIQNGYNDSASNLGIILNPSSLVSCRITNNNSLLNGTIYHIADIPLVTLFCSFENNTSNRGSAIFKVNGNLQILNTDFIENEATGTGAAIFSNNATLTLTGVTMTNNHVQGNGAVITNGNGALTINTSNFTANHSSRTTSSVIRTAENASVTITASNFRNNTITPVVINSSGNTTVDNCIFSDNNVQNNIAAIHTTRQVDTLTINNSIFQKNSSNERAAVYTTTPTVRVENSQFIENSTTSATSDGAALYSTAADLQINQSTFARNTTMGRAAAVYADNGDTAFSIIDSRFIANTSEHDGGAIYYEDNGGRHPADARIADCQFTDNESQKDGGAIHARGNAAIHFSNNTFTKNSSAKKGGALYLRLPNTDTIADSEFSQNKAESGGAIYIERRFTEDLKTLQFLTNTFSNNEAIQGGGIYYRDYRDARFDQVRLTNNTATTGGAIYFEIIPEDFIRTTQFTASQCIDNSATLRGGAIYTSSTNIQAQTTDFVGNTADRGGVAFILNKTMTVDRAHISNNRATREGAVYYLELIDATAQTYNSLIVGNSAASGTVLETRSSVDTSPSTFVNCTIAENQATNESGTIIRFIEDSNATCYNSIITQNLAAQSLLNGNVANCILTGNTSVESSTDVIREAPVFINPNTMPTDPLPNTPFTHYDFDYRLADNSVGFGSGNTAWVPAEFAIGLGGTNRTNTTIDLGAYQNNEGPVLNIVTPDAPTTLQIIAYPIPATTQLSVDAAQPIDALAIYGLDGRKITDNTQQSVINTQTLAQGMYLLKVTIGAQEQTIPFNKL